MRRDLVKVADVDRAREALRVAPEVARDTVTRSEAIRRLEPDISAARGRGYTLGDIVALLAEQGLHVSVASLKLGLRAAGGAEQPSRKRGRRKRSRVASRPSSARVMGQAGLAVAPDASAPAHGPEDSSGGVGVSGIATRKGSGAASERSVLAADAAGDCDHADGHAQERHPGAVEPAEGRSGVSSGDGGSGEMPDALGEARAADEREATGRRARGGAAPRAAKAKRLEPSRGARVGASKPMRGAGR